MAYNHMSKMLEDRKIEHESWRESLERFKRISSSAIKFASEIGDEGHGDFRLFQTESVESLTALEAYVCLNIPDSLKDLLLTYGPFQIGRRGSKAAFEIYRIDDHHCQNIKRFWDSIDVELSGLIKRFFSSTEIEELNKQYFIFGEICLGGDDREYLYFTDCGLFGTLIIYHDDDSGPNGIEEMINGNGNRFDSLDEVLSYCVNLKIDKINEWMRDHGIQ